jgi:hypothetical protein
VNTRVGTGGSSEAGKEQLPFPASLGVAEADADVDDEYPGGAWSGCRQPPGGRLPGRSAAGQDRVSPAALLLGATALRS